MYMCKGGCDCGWPGIIIAKQGALKQNNFMSREFACELCFDIFAATQDDIGFSSIVCSKISQPASFHTYTIQQVLNLTPLNMPQAKTEVSLQFSESCAAEVALQHLFFLQSGGHLYQKLRCNKRKTALQH